MDSTFDLQLIQEKAITLFNSGLNCSQSVLSAFSDNLNLDNKIALSVACGFGAGMGRLQGTCGAVTGAYMVFGLYCSQKNVDNNEKKESTYLMIQNFHDSFVAKHKTTECRLLLNCDLRTEEGQKQLHIDNLLETICENCIKDSIALICEQIQNN